ncbi:MAG: ABC transporter ATP-binding protein [Deltaproteobacteria bacterium]|nr:MAG: ABC transporter ATP-binding protein [Deltaproteobacteria bacterium]
MDNLQFEIRELTKGYHSKKVLDIPSLTIKKGKIYGVIGPNGSGKTTLLSILSLLMPPTSGTIYLEGVDIDKADKHSLRQNVTLVLQNPLLFNTTVGNNIIYGLKARGVKKGEQKKRLEECLKLVGLDGFEKRRAREHSGGEIQRIAIARALALNPRVLLLDEPTANVDRGSVALLEKILKELNQRFKITVILATHDITQAYRISDEVICLFEGKLARSPLENLYRGRVIKDKDISLFETGKIRVAILPEGDEVNHISIPPEDIIVSIKPISTSARNSFSGNISNVFDEGDSVRLEVDVGEKLRVKVTKKSFQEMNLNLGSHVYLTFKSSSVEVF